MSSQHQTLDFTQFDCMPGDKYEQFRENLFSVWAGEVDKSGSSVADVTPTCSLTWIWVAQSNSLSGPIRYTGTYPVYLKRSQIQCIWVHLAGSCGYKAVCLTVFVSEKNSDTVCCIVNDSKNLLAVNPTGLKARIGCTVT